MTDDDSDYRDVYDADRGHRRRWSHTGAVARFRDQVDNG
jgi:hypothetical protein